MQDLINSGQPCRNDLAGRMANNVVEAVVAYLAAPGTATAEQVIVLSAALQSLSALASAEQLQALAVALEPDDGVADGIINPEGNEEAPA